MLVRMWSNRDSHLLLMGIKKWYNHLGKNSLVTLEIEKFLKKLNITCDPAIVLFGIYPKELKT